MPAIGWSLRITLGQLTTMTAILAPYVFSFFGDFNARAGETILMTLPSLVSVFFVIRLRRLSLPQRRRVMAGLDPDEDAESGVAVALPPPPPPVP